MISQFDSDSMTEILLMGILLFQSFNKVVYFIRIYEPFSFLIIMMTNIFKDCIYFGGLFLFVMFGFAKLYEILHMGINDPTKQYSGISSPFTKLIIQTYKSSAGEKTVPKIEDDFERKFDSDSLAVSLILVFICLVWVIQQGFFGIVSTFIIGLI